MEKSFVLDGNNKLIADFIGLKSYNDDRYGLLWESPIPNSKGSNFSLRFHESWDWLIPVIDKIESLDSNERVSIMYPVTITGRGTDIEPSIYTCDTKWLIRHNSYNNRLGNTYKAVVEFIKWYNEQKINK